MSIFIATVIAALLTGFTGGWLLRGRKKRTGLSPSGQGPRREPEAQRSNEIGRAIGGRK